MGCCASKPDEFALRLKDYSRRLEGINLALRAKQTQATLAAGARGFVKRAFLKGASKVYQVSPCMS